MPKVKVKAFHLYYGDPARYRAGAEPYSAGQIIEVADEDIDRLVKAGAVEEVPSDEKPKGGKKSEK